MYVVGDWINGNVGNLSFWWLCGKAVMVNSLGYALHIEGNNPDMYKGNCIICWLPEKHEETTTINQSYHQWWDIYRLRFITWYRYLYYWCACYTSKYARSYISLYLFWYSSCARHIDKTEHQYKNYMQIWFGWYQLILTFPSLVRVLHGRNGVHLE